MTARKPVPVTAAFGRDFADELATWAMDMLMSDRVPLDGKTYAARVPWSQIREGRAILERRGIDWRKIAGDGIRARRERERADSEAKRQAYERSRS